MTKDTIMTMQVLEQYILDAEREFEQQNYLQGKNYLEAALEEEPTFGKAHNHMGWLYLYYLNDLIKAEKHLRLAIKYTSGYAAPYTHMISLLFDAKRMDEHLQFLNETLNVQGVSNSVIYNDFGRHYEVKGQYRKAIKYYKEGIKWSMDTQEINCMKDNIRRCNEKKWMFLFG
ncbi:MAG: O-linked GlcNAc transferase [Bacteroidota bacterium]